MLYINVNDILLLIFLKSETCKNRKNVENGLFHLKKFNIINNYPTLVFNKDPQNGPRIN